MDIVKKSETVSERMKRLKREKPNEVKKNQDETNVTFKIEYCTKLGNHLEDLILAHQQHVLRNSSEIHVKEFICVMRHLRSFLKEVINKRKKNFFFVCLWSCPSNFKKKKKQRKQSWAGSYKFFLFFFILEENTLFPYNSYMNKTDRKIKKDLYCSTKANCLWGLRIRNVAFCFFFLTRQFFFCFIQKAGFDVHFGFSHVYLPHNVL